MKKAKFKYAVNDGGLREVNIGLSAPLAIFDKESVEVENPYSGAKCMLEPVAIAIYDFIKGCEMTGRYGRDFDKARATFCENWPDEYMTLLD